MVLAIIGWLIAAALHSDVVDFAVVRKYLFSPLILKGVQATIVLSSRLGLDSGFWTWLNDLDFGQLGYGIVGLFVLTWAVSVAVWKTGRIEERWGSTLLERG